MSNKISNKNSNNSNNNFNTFVDSDEEKPPIEFVGPNPNNNSDQHNNNSHEENDSEYHIYNNGLSLWQQFHHHESF